MIFRNVYLRSASIASNSNRTLKDCLADFNKLVSEQASSQSVYEGWPPESRIDIKEPLKPLGRTLFVMNRRLENGTDFEPTLVFCCGSKPMLMMSKAEFSNFISSLPQIKTNLDTFFKQL